jgi:ABC-2 type transport system ATP-binding protein
MTVQPAVAIRGLTKAYDAALALDRVDLTVPEGSVFGFLGPNGAGKTTTLRILAGLAHPTAGHAQILGHDVVSATNQVRALIGYLPDVPGFYKWMTAREFLLFAGSLFAIERAILNERVAVLLDLAGLGDLSAHIGGYSRGMKQRLGVAQALINAPRLLLLDEPTSALDPIGRKEVLDMIASLGGRTTVFFSTHILSDVERVCDTVAILNRGRVVRQAGIDELRAGREGGHRIVVDVDDPGALQTALGPASWANQVERQADGSLLVTVNDLAAAQRALPAAVAAAGLSLQRMEVDEVSLEEVFVDLVEGGGA